MKFIIASMKLYTDVIFVIMNDAEILDISIAWIFPFLTRRVAKFSRLYC